MYISRNVRSSICESIVIRSNSVSFPTKCLIQLATPCDCTPFTYSTAVIAVRYGSSLMHSKLRPPIGVRCKFTVGARCTRAPFATTSLPNSSPMLRTSSKSQVAAIAVPHGTFIEAGPSNLLPRTPPGPSLTRIFSTPSRSFGTVFHMLRPASSDTCSAKVI